MMKLNQLITIIGFISLSSWNLSAQKLPDHVRPEDRELLNKQAADFFKAIDPLVKEISKSVVVIKAGDRVISAGTVTEKGVVTKYSELAKASMNTQSNIRMIAYDGSSYPIKLQHIYFSYDIAVIENTGKLPPVNMKKSETPALGSFIVAAGAKDQALAMGVVSVKPRSLMAEDKGFLGVVMDVNNQVGGGVLLSNVEKSSAADQAGLRPGDIILTVGGEAVANMLEMRNFLQKRKPGEEITISYKRDGVVSAGVKVKLGAGREIPQFHHSRINQMKSMGGKVNEISEGFPQVIQSDIQLESHFCGSPVVDLQGHFVGVVVAKASRINAYIIEGKKLSDLLNTAPDR